MIKVESKVASYAINVPTKREELTVESLGKLLENVTVAKYHCVIAMIYADTLFGVVNNKKEVDTNPFQETLASLKELKKYYKNEASFRIETVWSAHNYFDVLDILNFCKENHFYKITDCHGTKLINRLSYICIIFVFSHKSKSWFKI